MRRRDCHLPGAALTLNVEHGAATRSEADADTPIPV